MICWWSHQMQGESIIVSMRIINRLIHFVQPFFCFLDRPHFGTSGLNKVISLYLCRTFPRGADPVHGRLIIYRALLISPDRGSYTLLFVFQHQNHRYHRYRRSKPSALKQNNSSLEMEARAVGNLLHRKPGVLNV